MSGTSLLTKLSLDDIIDEAGFGLFQIKLSFSILFLVAQVNAQTQILSLIIPSLSTEWSLHTYEKSMLGFLEFIGFLIGSLSINKCVDKYGRKQTIIIAVWIWVIIMPLSTLSSNIYMFSFFRAFQGIILVIITLSSYMLLSESICSKYRSITLSFFTVFIIFSYILVLTLGIKLSDDLNLLKWRNIILITSILLPITQIFNYLCLEESSRFDIFNGNTTQGFRTLEKMYILNKSIHKFTDEKKIQLEQWILEFKSNISNDLEKGTKINIFAKVLEGPYRKLTFVLIYTWIVISSSFYGIELILPLVLNEIKGKENISELEKSHPLQKLLIANIFTMFVIIIVILLIQFKSFGRKISLALSLTMFGIGNMFIFLNFLFNFQFWLTVVKISTHLNWMFLFLYTSEMYPTIYRATVMGKLSAYSRIGQILIPWVSIYLSELYLFAPFLIFGFFSCIAGYSIYSLPYDTVNEKMERILVK